MDVTLSKNDKRRAITVWTQPDINASHRVVADLDALSRIRSLNDAESLLLERSICIIDSQRLPVGLTRALARFGIGRKQYTLKPHTTLQVGLL